MDLLAQIKNKITSNPNWQGARGIESVLTHIEIAERHHTRAKVERDEHLYTDVIYRTNHAYEGILKEAYVLLAGGPSEHKSPHEIEEYFLNNNTLRTRVIDLLKNYRQNWRNPSTHDYQLFFSEQESFLAIVNVSAFVSILLDQMLERVAYQDKYEALQDAALLARDEIADFSTLKPIDKVFRVLLSYADHYIKNFKEMSAYSRPEATAQLAAFVSKVAPELSIEQEVTMDGRGVYFDLVIADRDRKVAVQTREPRSSYRIEADIASEAAVNQLAAHLRAAGFSDGVLFQFPGRIDEQALATTASSIWPKDLNLRHVYGADYNEIEDLQPEDAPVSLVQE